MTKAEFLSKLADEARGNLSVELTQALVCEVAGHLDDGIQARLELGEAPEVAEINAVAGFAKPQQFVQKMEQVHDGVQAHDRVLLAFGSVFVLLLAFWISIATLQLASNMVWLLVLLGALVGIFVRSGFLRSPRWGTLKVLFIASIVLIGGMQPLLQLNLWDYGGMGYVPTASIHRYIDEERVEMEHPTRGWLLDSGETEMNIQAAERAAAAPLSERWRRSFGPSGGLMILSISMLLFAHLFPIVLRRRVRRRMWRV